MNKETKEIVALTEKWLNEIKEITVRYEKAIATLDTSRSSFETAKAGLIWKLLPFVYPLLILVAIGITIHIIGCGSYEVGSVKIVKECST
jgi:hypothetical protein